MSLKRTIERMGMLELVLGDKSGTFDVVKASDDWYVIDQSFRDESGAVPPSKWEAWNDAQKAFVAKLLNGADITRAEAKHIVAVITEEVAKLRDFFVPKSPEKPSSAESTEVRFSQ